MRPKFYVPLLMLMIGCSVRPAPNTLSRNEVNDLQQLSDGFIAPPMSARPGAFWCWLNGDVTNASITHDLEEMKEKGMGSADIYIWLP